MPGFDPITQKGHQVLDSSTNGAAKRSHVARATKPNRLLARGEGGEEGGEGAEVDIQLDWRMQRSRCPPCCSWRHQG